VLFGKLCIGHSFIQQGRCVLYRATRTRLEELANVTPDCKRKQHMELLPTVPLLIIADIGMRKPSQSRPMCLW
jgi:DNA replication protein DnaC